MILASLDVESHTRDDAEAIAAGVSAADVLLSDDYPSLNPGYWVVHTGSWGTRRQAGIWCPSSLAADLTCYPRYLGHSIPDLLNQGAGLAQMDAGLLVALDLQTGQRLATFSDDFHWEAEFPSSFALTEDAATLYFGMGWEDSWYSCASDGGEVWRLDLDSGIEEVFSRGWSPAISPDRRWLAVVRAAECYPDPEVDGWVMSPGSQVEVFDLTDGDNSPDYVLSSTPQPATYDDPTGVRWVTWDTGTGDMLVAMADGSVRRVSHDADIDLGDAEVAWASEIGMLVAASPSLIYVSEGFGDDGTAVVLYSRPGGDLVDVHEIDGWVTGFAIGRSGDVIISTWDYFILPDGTKVPVEWGINNLAW